MYYEILAKIKNASRAKHEVLVVPFSKMDQAFLKALHEAGYVKGVEKKSVGRRNFLEVKLAYKNSEPVLSDFKIVSKPSRRIYIDYRSLRPVRQGYGVGVLSTSSGLMSEKAARKKKIGGEYLAQIW